MLLGLAAGLGLAWAAICLGGRACGAGGWAGRLGLLGSGFAMACAALCYWHHRWLSGLRQYEQYLDRLTQLDWPELAAALANPAVAQMPRHKPWAKLAGRLASLLTKQCEQLDRLHQAKTAMEVRCQRATNQCERIRQILNGVSDPIVAIDGYDELLLANPAAEELFGFPHKPPEKRAIAQLVRCQRLVELLTSTNRRRASGYRVEELEIPDQKGRSEWYRVHVAKLVSAENGNQEEAPSGAVAVLRDVGAQKALQKRNAEFVSAVSHEMKTPLAGIKAYVELLADGDAEDDATREEFLEVINSQADRLQRLVDNLLNLARIEAGVVQVNKQSRPLNELLEEALRVVQPSAEAKSIKLLADLSPLYLGVLADRDLLLQAAINLLSNAVKYTPEGGTVTLRSRSADEHVLFEVEDTGVGLSEEDCQRVFEKFYRVKKDQKMASGTGLGLPLAKHIVEDVHGGRITVRSQLGAGSTFTVVLPKAGQMG